VYSTLEPQKDYVESALITIHQIHSDHPKGDVLVFLSGQEEIDSLQSLLLDVEGLLPLPLYASLSLDSQQKVFEKSHLRKVILATNVAETSITIPGIK
jgi:HrpA-like RNA helicase